MPRTIDSQFMPEQSQMLSPKTIFATTTPMTFCCLLAVLLTIQSPGAAHDAMVLNDDAGWCWFEDERALIDNGKLFVGSVANGRYNPARRGDIEIVSHDLDTRRTIRRTLHKNLEADDHDSPALWKRPDGRILAMYSRHGAESRIYHRVSTRPSDASEWLDEIAFVPSDSSKVTYSNLHWLGNENGRKGRLYNFFRGYDNTFKPSRMFSDDFGATWQTSGVFIDFPAAIKHRPYVKYASNGRDTVHFAFTEGHPRNFNNSIYHAFYREGGLHRSDGTLIRKLYDGSILPAESTRVFEGDADNVAWIQDLHLDERGFPRMVYSVQKGSANKPQGQGGNDHRYRFSRWDGQRWLDMEIAYAGSKLYAGEDDYTGGICLHPDEPQIVFISTNVDPSTGEKLVGGHHELFRGAVRGSSLKCDWTQITANSPHDNLRPMVPKWKRGKTALLWLRGSYHSYTRYEQEIVLRIWDGMNVEPK